MYSEQDSDQNPNACAKRPARPKRVAAFVVAGLIVVAVAGWFEFAYTEQVNATIRVQKLIDSGASTDGATLEHRGRQFGVYRAPECIVLVSYGSDNAPDRSDYAQLCERGLAPGSSCWWSTLDTVAIGCGSIAAG